MHERSVRSIGLKTRRRIRIDILASRLRENGNECRSLHSIVAGKISV